MINRRAHEKAIFLLMSALILTGCEQSNSAKQRSLAKEVIATLDDRFVLERVAIVRDSLAYGNERGIYILWDSETNAEYIGVSGIGITELRSSRAGNTVYSYEH